VHALEYLPGSGTTIYAGCDGGVFKSTNSGTAWSDVSNGLQIAQQYRLGVSQTNAALTLTGWQDNGTNLQNGTACSEVDFGDGFECIINRANASTMYAEVYYGSIDKSTNTGTSFPTNIVASGGTAGTVDEDGDWNTPYIQHPTTAATLLVGKSQVYRTTNSGTSWTTVGNLGSGVILTSLAYSPSNPNYIYASSGSGLWVSTNGTSFTNMSATLPTNITSMAVHPLYPATMWITSSGYTPGTKVFVTRDAGATWTNCSSGLPNVPCHSIVYQVGSNGGLYMGNDIGVFYRDSTMTNWIAYSYGMPNVVVDELEIQVSGGKLRAATYGRGLWETDLYTAPVAAPVAAFNSNMTTACKNQQVDFYDLSTNLPYSWTWTFTGGTPSTSTLQFPTVTYAAAGTYPVKLVVTNQAGSDSSTVNSYIVINPSPTINAGADTTICKGDTIQLNATGGVNYVWGTSTSLSNIYISNPLAFPITNKVFSVTGGDANGCKAIDTKSVTVIQPFATPVISAAGNQLTVTPGTPNYAIQWYYNGTPIAGGTTQTITADSTGNYTVLVADTFGCHSLTSLPYTNVGIGQVNGLSNWNFFPNPSKGKINISVGNNYSGTIYISVYSSEGKLIEAENKTVTANETFQLKAELTQGIYLLQLRENNGKLLGTRRVVVTKE
jgi:PKD repeat protein